MLRHLLTFFFFVFGFFSFAQEKITITGTVMDVDNNIPVSNLIVILGNSKDSATIASAQTNENGYFKLSTSPKTQSSYILIKDLQNTKYKKNFPSILSDKELGKITIKSNEHLVKEVVVTAVKPIVVKQDTIEYNADSFKVKPNANLENLLRELPGFEIDDNGAITVNGKGVNEVLIDGESFFGTDGKVALENLPAEIIKKVQVSDFKTKNEKFSGERSTSDKSSLNIALKENKNKGYLIKATGGYGSDNHYESNLMVNYFKGKRRFSLIGSSTDIASSGMVNGFGSIGRRGMGRNSSSGITTNTSVGLNYNDQLNDNLKIGTDYRLSHSFTKNDNYTRQENLNTDNIFTTTSNSKTKNENYGHNFGTNLEWTKKGTKIFFYPSFSNSSSNSSSLGSSESIDQHCVLKNTTNTDSHTKTNANTFTNFLTFYQRLKDKSYFDLSSTISLGKTNGNTREISNAIIYDGSSSNTNRNVNTNNKAKNDSYNFNLKYTRPITDSIKMALGSVYNYSDSETNNISLNYNEDTHEFDSVNDDLTRLFRTKINLFNPYAQFLLNKKKLSATVKAGANVYKQDNFGLYKSIEKNLTLNKTLPQLDGNIRFQSGDNMVMLMYSYNTSLPGTSQLLDLEDKSSLTTTITGNPNLDPNKSHTLSTMFGNFNRKTRQGFNANINYTYSTSSVTSSTVTNQDLTRKITYENVKGNYAIRGFFFYNKQFQKGVNKLRLNMGVSTSYGLTQGFNENIRYKSYNTSLSPNIRINWDYGDNLTIAPSYRLTFAKSKYENYRISGQDNVIHNFGLNTITTWFKKLTWTNDFNYNYNSRLSAGFKKDFFLWNTSVMYRFYNDKLIAGVKVYDLLKQNNNYTRTITDQYIRDERNNMLTRFIMFSLTLNINKYGGKKSQNRSFDGPPPERSGGDRPNRTNFEGRVISSGQ